MKALKEAEAYNGVAPFTGAWIEIFSKSDFQAVPVVAPFTGAWIEIGSLQTSSRTWGVAPFTGAWIEISQNEQDNRNYAKSHPSRVRGLKSTALRQPKSTTICRTLHGCVD